MPVADTYSWDVGQVAVGHSRGTWIRSQKTLKMHHGNAIVMVPAFYG